MTMPDEWWKALQGVLMTAAAVGITALLKWLGWMPVSPAGKEALDKATLALMRLDRKDREEFAAAMLPVTERKVEDRNA